IALVVLRADEFEEQKGGRGGPLAAVKLLASPGDAMPPADQLWAWAHVHVNKDIIQNGEHMDSTDMASTLGHFESVLAANPDHAYSRIVCLRHLEPSTRYHAFLMPS